MFFGIQKVMKQELISPPFYEYELLIREFHLDSYGHVNNATYLALLEEARWEMITKNGYGLERVKSLQIGPIILEISIRFLKELPLREKIKIRTKIAQLEKKIAPIYQEIWNENMELCACATLKSGLFDLKNRKLIAPTLEWKNALGIST